MDREVLSRKKEKADMLLNVRKIEKERVTRIGEQKRGLLVYSRRLFTVTCTSNCVSS